MYKLMLWDDDAGEYVSQYKHKDLQRVRETMFNLIDAHIAGADPVYRYRVRNVPCFIQYPQRGRHDKQV